MLKRIIGGVWGLWRALGHRLFLQTRRMMYTPSVAIPMVSARVTVVVENSVKVEWRKFPIDELLLVIAANSFLSCVNLFTSELSTCDWFQSGWLFHYLIY